MKAYKLKEKTDYLDKGRIFCQINGQQLVVATFTKPHHFISNHAVDRFNSQGLLEEIDLMDEKKSHPHLFKPLKEEVYKLKK